MPKIDATKEGAIKRGIRLAMAIDPLISVARLQRELLKKGFHTAAGNPIKEEYLLKLIHKINGEARYQIENDQISERMIVVRERFQAIFERLFKIAFWEWEYLNEYIPMPEVKDQIKAMEAIMKMDIALVEAEMDAGIFKRNLGTLEVERRNVPLTPERKQAIIAALQNWGLIKPVEAPATLPENATAKSTTQSAGT